MAPQEISMLDPATAAFYRRAMQALDGAGAPFMVGGAYALERYTGIARHTKDFDIFVRGADCDRVLDVLAGMGCRTERTFPHWLAKAHQGELFIDVIYSAGSGIAVVDEEWFQYAERGVVLDLPALLIPPEEMIWSKAFVQERERFDGADVMHLLHCRAEKLDWKRLLRRFGPDWRVLLGHVVLFGFVYPHLRDAVPARIVEALAARLRREGSTEPIREPVCRGTLLSRAQYLTDVNEWGHRDARLEPRVAMSEEDIAHWTRAIDEIP
ncbi:MAG TPA: hypothetical protein VMT87_14650 [Vicinamibacteria bacterium]|nr:hypothetical protein [Vicinamibacteria bacterium]